MHSFCILAKWYLFSIFETLDSGHDGPASPDGATPRDGLKVNSKAFRPEDAKQIRKMNCPFGLKGGWE